uniref:Uncharacterized protein n=1 Tax=Lactuca sativa TaxID=4236 RepID=A0A9R1V1R9_LACSA|nr:hypothetical protein LSAT_V11C700348460 [Lactuca sativa]
MIAASLVNFNGLDIVYYLVAYALDCRQSRSIDHSPIQKSIIMAFSSQEQETQGSSIGISICKKATVADKLNMNQLEDAYEKKKSDSQTKEVQLLRKADVGFKKRKGISTPIERAFGVEIRD